MALFRQLLIAMTFVSRAVIGATPLPLNITAISSRGGYSVLECWQLDSVPVDARSAANYLIGETTKATWSRIEPRTTVGEAWAPTVQYIFTKLPASLDPPSDRGQAIHHSQWTYQNHLSSANDPRWWCGYVLQRNCGVHDPP